MNTTEFWCSVYVAAIQARAGSRLASEMADQAEQDFKSRHDVEQAEETDAEQRLTEAIETFERSAELADQMSDDPPDDDTMTAGEWGARAEAFREAAAVLRGERDGATPSTKKDAVPAGDRVTADMLAVAEGIARAIDPLWRHQFLDLLRAAQAVVSGMLNPDGFRQNYAWRETTDAARSVISQANEGRDPGLNGARMAYVYKLCLAVESGDYISSEARRS